MSIEETTLEAGITSKQVKKNEKKILFRHLTKLNLNLFELMGDYQNLLMEAEGFNLRGTDR